MASDARGLANAGAYSGGPAEAVLISDGSQTTAVHPVIKSDGPSESHLALQSVSQQGRGQVDREESQGGGTKETQRQRGCHCW